MVYTATSAATGRPIQIHEKDGRIARIDEAAAEDGLWVAPGLIDIQVNGFAGVDYNSPGTPSDEIARSIDVIKASGVTRFYPTVITGSNSNICGSLANLARAKRELPAGPAMPGFHVEGPWISALDGPRGAHPLEHVRPPTIEEFHQFQEAAEGHVRLITLAPESEGALPVIEYLVEQGVVVSIGHTGASPEQVRDAVSAGATMSTHLGNGAHSMLQRHPNYIIEQMAADELCASLIGDGIHLPPSFLKVAVRAKGLDRSILVTDAVSPAGCKPGIFRVGHLEVVLRGDDSVRLTDTGRLAGSALKMDRGVENLMRFAGVSLVQALRMATVNPAAAMGLEGRRGFLEPGDICDLILFGYDPDRGKIDGQQTVCSPLEAG